MTRLASLVLVPMLASACLAGSDVLRFENGDQLRGSFIGAGSGLIRFQPENLAEPVEAKVDALRHLVLRSGQPAEPVSELAHIGLVNGDRLPGKIIGMDDTHLTIDTGIAGVMRVPRDRISLLAANPLGGRVHFHGPFSDQGWQILSSAKPNKQAAVGKEEDEDVSKKVDKPAAWEFSGSAWYWPGTDGAARTSALARPDVMPDRSVLRFELAWKNRLGVSVVFNADMKGAAAATDNKEDQAEDLTTNPLPAIFGNAYVLQIYSSHAMLYRSSYDPKHGPRLDRVQAGVQAVRLNDVRSAVIEIRSNRTNGLISLFVDDEFVTQWSEPPFDPDNADSFAGRGGGFGFLPQTGDYALRVSGTIVSEWNGLPDSARSMELDAQDVLLMTNGTDRFAGKVAGIAGDGRLSFESRHGKFLVPLEEIAEVRFARSHLAKAEESSSGDARLFFSPIGRITGRLNGGDEKLVRLDHPVLGPIHVRTGPMVMIEFKPEKRIADDWDDDF